MLTRFFWNLKSPKVKEKRKKKRKAPVPEKDPEAIPYAIDEGPSDEPVEDEQDKIHISDCVEPMVSWALYTFALFGIMVLFAFLFSGSIGRVGYLIF